MRIADERLAELERFALAAEGSLIPHVLLQWREVLGLIGNLRDEQERSTQLRTLLRGGKGLHFGPTTGTCLACGTSWTWRLGEPECHADGCILTPTEAESAAAEAERADVLASLEAR